MAIPNYAIVSTYIGLGKKAIGYSLWNISSQGSNTTMFHVKTLYEELTLFLWAALAGVTAFTIWSTAALLSLVFAGAASFSCNQEDGLLNTMKYYNI